LELAPVAASPARGFFFLRAMKKLPQIGKRRGPKMRKGPVAARNVERATDPL
jgi:hypothetical protein